MPINYEAIPQPLRELKQFCLWRFEDSGNKPTKVPYQINGKLLDVTNPKHYATFEQVLTTIRGHKGIDGIGFIFTKKDPYCGIDLDYSEVPEIIERQKLIFEKFDSYSEISPSGRGLHIIIEAELASGCRHDKIEIYSHNRFFAMTGNVYHDAPIAHRQELALLLWEQMGKRNEAPDNAVLNETCTDVEIIEQALKASNGDKFHKLYNGEWQEIYASQSEADFALVDIIAFYTQARNQIVRIFRNSTLGKRKKAHRADYIEYMLNRAFDNQPPMVDIDLRHNEVVHAIETLPTVLEAQERASDDERAFVFPPGLLGEIADYIYRSAPRPVRSIALTAAIGLMAGICGRTYNVSGSGLNQYLLILAASGVGKEAGASGIMRLMTAMSKKFPSALKFVGPSEIASGQALLKTLATHSPSFVSLLGEFGQRLRQLSASHNSAEIMLQRVLLDLYSKSGGDNVLGGMNYSQSDKNVDPVKAPSFSFLADSIPDNVYKELDEDLISAGLIPRFTIFECSDYRVPYNKAHNKVKPTEALLEKLGFMVEGCHTMNRTDTVIDIKIEEDADKLLDEINKYCDTKINGNKTNTHRELWSRFHLKVMRLAALVAVGINPYYPTVTTDCVQWAAKLINESTTGLLSKFSNNEIGKNTEETEQHKLVRAKIKEYVTGTWEQIKSATTPRTRKLFDNKVVTHEYLSRKLYNYACFRKDKRGAGKALQATIDELVKFGYIEIIPKNKLQKDYELSVVAYTVSDSQTIIAGA